MTSNFLTGALGSPVAVTYNAAVVQTEYTYESFGKTTATGASNSSSYQYTGRENDGTGLYYYRARYYHPGLQRFIQEDPIGLDSGYTNHYSYVGNNPMTFTDPSGLSAAAGAAVGAGIGAPAGPWGSVVGGIAGAVLGAAALAKLIETIGVPSEPMATPDFSNSPEGCSLNFEICMGRCRNLCDKFERVKCTLKCVAAYVGCMLTNY